MDATLLAPRAIQHPMHLQTAARLDDGAWLGELRFDDELAQRFDGVVLRVVSFEVEVYEQGPEREFTHGDPVAVEPGVRDLVAFIISLRDKPAASLR